MLHLFSVLSKLIETYYKYIKNNETAYTTTKIW